MLNNFLNKFSKNNQEKKSIEENSQLLERQKEAVKKGEMKPKDVGYSFKFLDGDLNYWNTTYNLSEKYVKFDKAKMIKKSEELNNLYVNFHKIIQKQLNN